MPEAVPPAPVLQRKLDAAACAELPIERIAMDQESFARLHAADRMASEKLEEGIAGFTKALESLEDLLAKRLAVLEG